jgi:hypothetical protein
MATATVPEIPISRKPAKAFYAQLHGLSGVLTKPADAVLFLEHESGAVGTISQADAPDLVVLGAVAPSMAQYIDDMARGGYAKIACDRLQEVA